MTNDKCQYNMTICLNFPWGPPTEVQIHPNYYILLWFTMMLAMLLGLCSVSSCQRIAKQLLRCFWAIANWSISNETSIKSLCLDMKKKKWIFFFVAIFFFDSLNSNKIQVRWCLHACFDSFPLSLPYSELCHSLCSVQWTSKGSFTSSWSMLTPSCFLKTVGFVLTLYIIIITDTLDIHNTAWNRLYHLIVRSVLKMVFENQL